MEFSVTQDGKKLDPRNYTWDEKTKTFSTKENNLVLDFSNWNGCTFKTGSHCTFKTGSHCTFKTDFCCTFYTGSCCTFTTGSDCTFKTDSGCTFNTGSGCTFNTDSGCMFKTGFGCTFKTGAKCVVVRWDVFEVIQLVENQTIKLNTFEVPGYQVIEKHVISIDGKEIELSEESYQNLKKSLT